MAKTDGFSSHDSPQAVPGKADAALKNLPKVIANGGSHTTERQAQGSASLTQQRIKNGK